MGSKRKLAAALCFALCLLTACSGREKGETPAETVPVYSHTASSQNWVYIEFDPCYDPQKLTASLTPADSKNSSSEIPLEYYPSVNGCLLTLEEGAYCIELRYSGEDAPREQSRYFVVDGEHSYYHIHFTDKA